MQRKHGAVPGLSRQEVSQLERVGFSDGRLGHGREMKDGLPPPHPVTCDILRSSLRFGITFHTVCDRCRTSTLQLPRCCEGKVHFPHEVRRPLQTWS